MNISLGWIFFLGGVAGFIKVLRMSSLAEVSGYSEQKKENQSRNPIKLWVRLLLLGINLLLIAGGATAIQKKHNWNPFAPCASCKSDGGAVS